MVHYVHMLDYHRHHSTMNFISLVRNVYDKMFDSFTDVMAKFTKTTIIYS